MTYQSPIISTEIQSLIIWKIVEIVIFEKLHRYA